MKTLFLCIVFLATALGLSLEYSGFSERESLGIPLSKYQGPNKKEITEAIAVAKEMGMVLPPVFVSKVISNPDKAAIALCVRGPKLTEDRKIVISAPTEGQLTPPPVWVYVLIHEWAHCEIQLDHDKDGLMAPVFAALDARTIVKNLVQFNSEHKAKLNLKPMFRLMRVPEKLWPGLEQPSRETVAE